MNKVEIQNLIKDIIEKTGVKLKDISITEESPTNTWFAVEVEEPHFFVSRDAEALHALNHLVRRILEPKNVTTEENKITPSVLIDINGFHKKRADEIRAVAHMMSERARYFKSSVEVNPMSAFDRRIVHEFLSNATDLKTESIGAGNTRRVVIKYIGAI